MFSKAVIFSIKSLLYSGNSWTLRRAIYEALIWFFDRQNRIAGSTDTYIRTACNSFSYTSVQPNFVNNNPSGDGQKLGLMRDCHNQGSATFLGLGPHDHQQMWLWAAPSQRKTAHRITQTNTVRRTRGIHFYAFTYAGAGPHAAHAITEATVILSMYMYTV